MIFFQWFALRNFKQLKKTFLGLYPDLRPTSRARPVCDCLGVQCHYEGDVEQCQNCERWWVFPGRPISKQQAAELAREPMDPYDVLEALDSTEQSRRL